MITVSTTVHIPLAKVWQYWNEPEHIMQWNAASKEWHCPKAFNDVRDGGTFSYRMEAKDGSIGFDLSGRYDRIVEGQVIESSFDDNRKVITTFQEHNDGSTEVSQSFDPDGENPEEPQRQGWQAILNNFKNYAEKQ